MTSGMLIMQRADLGRHQEATVRFGLSGPTSREGEIRGGRG